METIYDVFRLLLQAGSGRLLTEPEIATAATIIDQADPATRQEKTDAEAGDDEVGAELGSK